MMPGFLDPGGDLGRRLNRWFERHRREVEKTLDLIDRSPHATLVARSPSGDRILVEMECRTLRTVPHRTEPVERDVTPVEILCPPVGMFELSHLRVAVEQLPAGELPYNCHVRADKLGTICTGTKWTPLTFGLDLLTITAFDVLRGDNILADFRDTFNPFAVPHFQRLRSEGKLPLDARSII